MNDNEAPVSIPVSEDEAGSVIERDELVEEVSIDGMCGVY